jgi:hypothetical protein
MTHITRKNGNFEISLLCLLPSHHMKFFFWGCGIQWTARKVFYIQKRTIGIMAVTKKRDCCREVFKKFNVLPLAREFLLSVSSFVVDNVLFQTSTEYVTFPRYAHSSPWWWKQHSPLKHQSTSIWLHGSTSQKTQNNHKIQKNIHVPNTNLNKYQKEFTILQLSYSINFHLISNF